MQTALIDTVSHRVKIEKAYESSLQKHSASVQSDITLIV